MKLELDLVDAARVSMPLSSLSFFHSVLHWSVAVSTMCHHSSQVVSFLQAVARPEFSGPRAASIARSQVSLGLPTVKLKVEEGTCRMLVFNQCIASSCITVSAKTTTSNISASKETSSAKSKSVNTSFLRVTPGDP